VARVRRDVALALLDLAIVFGAYLAPLVLRFNGVVPQTFWANFRWFVVVAAFVHLSSNYLFGLYGQMWRYASVQEARRVVLASAFAGAVMLVTALVLTGHRLMPLSVVILGATLSLVVFGAVRFQSRMFGFRRRSVVGVERSLRVLLVGAGEAGSMVLKDIRRNPSVGLVPVGIVDDDPKKIGLSLNGVPVLGKHSAIPALAPRLRVDQVLLAVPSATSELIRDVAGLCE